MTHLRILLDMVKGTSNLHPEKLVILKELFSITIYKKKCTLKKIQSALEHLNFA